MFSFSAEDYEIMSDHDWSIDYVINILEGYASDYALSFREVQLILDTYGVNELFDGVPLACEELAEMLN